MEKKLNLIELSKVEEKNVKGGMMKIDCSCACAYVNCGGSSTVDNFRENAMHNLHSPEGSGC